MRCNDSQSSRARTIMDKSDISYLRSNYTCARMVGMYNIYYVLSNS